MAHHRTPDRRRSAAASLAVTFVALALAGAIPRAQTAPPAGSRPTVVRLERGRPFRGDLRQLPTVSLYSGRPAPAPNVTSRSCRRLAAKPIGLRKPSRP